ncbi:hypothetical protein SAMN06295912_101288 [Sphingomonas laterariae]|uniref:Hpt domain-containing protein n=2 Tax=Edaphosphingomonas laterariae TaxID=861865 RepID=A0A239BP81_9SPHN|nr:Hpt domain-containing protein [Sphingomonas laterariae]SNS09171.1 hypothetical protein SAMN06295912_101288 [Sphingomonas laterariae]
MMYDPGALETALAAAVGDDPALVTELRSVFLASARGHADALDRAVGASEWRVAAMRLQGLAASFGAVQLMTLAERAVGGVPGDATMLAAIRRAIDSFAA